MLSVAATGRSISVCVTDTSVTFWALILRCKAAGQSIASITFALQRRKANGYSIIRKTGHWDWARKGPVTLWGLILHKIFGKNKNLHFPTAQLLVDRELFSCSVVLSCSPFCCVDRIWFFFKCHLKKRLNTCKVLMHYLEQSVLACVRMSKSW